MKKSKQWLLLFAVVTAVGMAAFMLVNYQIDAVGYFSVERGADSVDANGYTRAAKSKYLKKYGENYNAVILGGSKSGVLSTELLSEYTGRNYYNFYVAYGCFADFLTYAEYLIDNTSVEEILLHLSSIEVQKYDRSDTNEIYEVPAVVDGNLPELALETLNYLCRNITSSLEYAWNSGEELEKGRDSLATGERNYSYPYSLMEADPDGYVEEYVLTRYDSSLKQIFDGKNPNIPAVDENLNAMRKLKALCDEKGVTLRVVIGPTFLAELRKFEGEPYYKYLKKLVSITEVWDFSGFTPENLNPYNFVNEGHYTNAVADEMLAVMFGKSDREGFGILLTEETIAPYLKARRQSFEMLQEEYEKTGTIQLQTRNDDSYIGA